MDPYAMSLPGNTSVAHTKLIAQMIAEVGKDKKQYYINLFMNHTYDDLIIMLNGLVEKKKIDIATTEYYPENDDDNFFTHPIQIKIILVVAPILLLFGVIGNILSFAVLMRPPMRRISTYRYLAALSLADTAVLLLGLFPLWIGNVNQAYDPMSMSHWSCKLLTFLLCSVSTYSTWMIIAMTTERYIAVCHPLKAASYCTTSRAVKVIVCMIGITMAIHLHMFFSLELKGSPSSHCVAVDHFEFLIDKVWPWVDAFLYSFVPSAVVIILNGCRVNSAIQSRRRRLLMLQDDQSTSNRPRGVSKSAARGVARTFSRSHSYAHSESGSRLTIMLLSISFTFLVSTLPVNIILITRPLRVLRGVQVEQKILDINICRLLMYVNHSANLLLYCATGQKFRQQFFLMISQRKMNWNTDSYGSTFRSVAGFKNVTANDSAEMDKLAKLDNKTRRT